MKLNELIQRTDAAVAETRNALQIVYNSLNKGQRMQLIRSKSVKALFDRYGVEYE